MKLEGLCQGLNGLSMKVLHSSGVKTSRLGYLVSNEVMDFIRIFKPNACADCLRW